ncbi:hypothetical protein M9Y10_040768 [Tritrichomonas musculus]|uniref:Uncharacterized protein n=1 Tax=Tritrichomonas musculus TaxID=1915356 RepID=A0ABR2K2I8_9EUKA
MSNPDQIVKEIENYLKNDQQKLNTFNKLISSINENMANPDQIYHQIIELIQENEQLVNVFKQGLENFDTGVDAFSELLRFVQTVELNTNSKSNSQLVADFSHVISLFTNELVTVLFFNDRINKLANTLPSQARRAIKDDLDRLINKIRNSQEKVFFKTIRESFSREFDDDFIIKPEYTPSILVQILVMTGCVCDPDQINLILHALTLYSSYTIPIDAVFHRLESINNRIAQAFDIAASTENIENFYPPAIFETMKEELTLDQLKWVLGENLYDALCKMGNSNEKPPSFLDLALKFKKESIKQKDRNEPATIPYIAELQCIKMFSIIKNMADFYSSSDLNQQPKIPQYLIDLLFGPEKFEQDSSFYELLIEKCISLGTEANIVETHFLEHRLGIYIPSSNDWRATLHEKFQKRYLVHTLFFTGRSFEIRNEEEEESSQDFDVLKETSDLVRKFSKKFSRLNPKAIDAFLKMFDGGDFDLIEEAAIAVACFMEILEMVDELHFSPKESLPVSESLSKIPQIIWEETSPLLLFDNLSIANIDIPLKYFIRNLHKAYEKYPKQFQLNSYSFPPTGIAYHLSANVNNYTIKGYINPTFD